ncbi:MAG: 1-deoxy-D-xylulose-5-phosphate reductoisomerase [Planctomycetaceae bacterium]
MPLGQRRKTLNDVRNKSNSVTTPQSIVVLGSTGSIGTNCLDVIRSHPQRMRLVGATACRSAETLLRQAAEFQPDWILLSDPLATSGIDTTGLSQKTQLFPGESELDRLIRDESVDTVVSAVVGAAGLQSTWAAVDSGKRVALANKESLVVAGPLMTSRAAETGATLIPVDSEHSAVFQALQAGRKQDLRRIILTASGGPFRGWTAARMKTVTPEMALKHPTWEMGPKITIDSATMMNKALEIIEARWLFGVNADQISVVVHPQSFIHSFVEYRDGSVISQMSPPDMRLPIQYALTYPDRINCPGPDTDWGTPTTLELFPPDLDAFPALRLGFEVAGAGGTAGAILNAANEVAVDRFLKHDLRFDQITLVSQDILNHHTFEAQPTLDQLQQADRWARQKALRWNS